MTGKCGRMSAVDGAWRIRGVLLHLGQNMWGVKGVCTLFATVISVLIQQWK